jgi:hypothetical protein
MKPNVTAKRVGRAVGRQKKVPDSTNHRDDKAQIEADKQAKAKAQIETKRKLRE